MDALGNVTSKSLGNGLTTTLSYDPRSTLLTGIQTNSSSGTVQNLSYAWDMRGNLLSRTDIARAQQETFTYDNINRLTQANFNGSNSHTLSLTYAANGNITYKSDVGSYTYGAGNAGPHAVTQAGNRTFTYDANGNLIQEGSKNITYTPYSRTASIVQGGIHSSFEYGTSKNLIKRTDTRNNETTTTWFIAGMEYKTYDSGTKSGTREYKRTMGQAQETITYQGTTYQHDTTHYFLGDHLGSLHTITNEDGDIVQKLSFDAFGARRDVVTGVTLASTVAFETNITTKGFTGHETIDGTGLVHMKARIYDPKLGRFLSADRVIQDPYSTQSLNRYSYVFNNPLNATDPTGEVVFTAAAIAIAVGAGLAAAGYILDIPELVQIGSIVGAVGCGALASFAGAVACAGFMSFGTTLAQGATFEQALKAGVISAASAGATRGIGGHFKEAGKLGGLGHVLSSGAVGGISAELQGGKFAHGFASAAVTTAVSSNVIGSIEGTSAGADIARTSLAALVGGTTSELTGGKFVNGAVSAAIAHAVGTGVARGARGRPGFRIAQEGIGGEDRIGGEDIFSDDIKNHYIQSKIKVDKNGRITTDTITVSYSSGISEETAKAYIAVAMEGWSDIGLKLQLVVGNGDLHILPCNPTSCTNTNSENGGYYGAAERGGTEIYYGTGQRVNTPVHELGHILGLGHRGSAPGSIMSYSLSRAVTKSDISRVRKLYEYNPASLCLKYGNAFPQC